MVSSVSDDLKDFMERANRAVIFDPLQKNSDFGDHMINPDMAPLESDGLRDAAVLMPLVDRPDGVQVLLTLRTNHLPSHAGQVAFPGGKIDAGDVSPLATALRETEEEVGISPALVSVLGATQTYQTRSGYRIVPVLGVVQSDYQLALNENEVEQAFEVPLRYLMDPDNHVRSSRVWQGTRRHFYEMPYNGHHIWGVTAGVIRSIYLQLYETV